MQSLKKLGFNMESLGKGGCIQQIEVKYFKKSSFHWGENYEAKFSVSSIKFHL
jgi:hypothetical protein